MRLPAGILGLTITSAIALTSLSADAADIYRPEPGGYKDGPIYVLTRQAVLARMGLRTFRLAIRETPAFVLLLSGHSTQ